MSLVLEHLAAPTDDARALIGELEAELSGDYEPHQRHGLSIEKVFQPHITFFVAREGGKAVGCGGIAFEDGFAEIKRMYVRKKARGRNIAQTILARLEDEARAKGYKRVTLETGDVLAPAIRLYERFRLHPLRPLRRLREDAGARGRAQRVFREADLGAGPLDPAPRRSGRPAQPSHARDNERPRPSIEMAATGVFQRTFGSWRDVWSGSVCVRSVLLSAHSLCSALLAVPARLCRV